MAIRYGISIHGQSGSGQDRAEVTEFADGIMITLADGAGGTSGGAEAADMVVQATVPRGGHVVDVLYQLDEVVERDPAAGESTAVLQRSREVTLLYS